MDRSFLTKHLDSYLGAQETGGRVDGGVQGRHLDEAVNLVLLGELGNNTGSLNMDVREREVAKHMEQRAKEEGQQPSP